MEYRTRAYKTRAEYSLCRFKELEKPFDSVVRTQLKKVMRKNANNNINNDIIALI